MIKTDYISIKEAATLWKMDASNIGKLCRKGKITGAKLVGKSWLIPKNTERPLDGRTKAAKTEAKEDFFRFPLYVNRGENDFVPILSDEERMLRNAQLDFLACDFKKAQKGFNRLISTAASIYIRQISLFFMCLISANDKNGNGFKFHYINLEISLSEDFPRKKEMELLLPLLFSGLSLYENCANAFNIDEEYNYSPDVYPLMAHLSFCNSEILKKPEIIDLRSNIYKLTALEFERNGHFFEAQMIHISLILTAFMKHDKASTIFHLKKTVEIAFRYHFIFPIAEIYSYYKPLFENILENYPPQFSEKVKKFGNSIYKSFGIFTNEINNTDLYSQISGGEFKFIIYAAEGYSYKQIANDLHISQRTVANRYAKIYDKLGVDNKQGLLAIIKDSTVKKESKKRYSNTI